MKKKKEYNPFIWNDVIEKIFKEYNNIPINKSTIERLTPEHGWNNASYDPWEICGLDSVCERDCHEPEFCAIPKMLRRLAEYEDIGLTPEQIKKLIK